MIHESVYELRRDIGGVLHISDERVQVIDEEALRAGQIDTLVRDAVFGTKPVKEFAQWLIWETGQTLGARPASIHDYYIARGHDRWTGRTVPAMNIRGATYDTTRAALRAALKSDTGAMIFEIARSEMAYTDQPPSEYSACVIAAAIKEGYHGRLFIQGDHFQVNAKKYRQDPEGAIAEVKELIAAAIPAGFWNIDIDTSTLVTLEPESLRDQQLDNFTRSAEITRFVRGLEPDGVTVSLGGEIGEVGEKNSTPEELEAYVENYNQLIDGLPGLSKISVATGTSHGGVVLPDGSMASVAVDFDTLNILGKRARDYAAGGAVQHGASTLPRELFRRFPEVQTLEIHLATGFTNCMMDNPAFPADLREMMYAHLDTHNVGDRKPGMTDVQFHLRERKRTMGAFKAELWALPEEAYGPVFQSLEEEFAFYYRELNVAGSRAEVEAIVTAVEYHKPMPTVRRIYGDDLGLAD